MQPKIIHIQFTSHCNWKCKVCSSYIYDHLIKREHMSEETFNTLLDQLHDIRDTLGLIHIIGYIGEATLHPRFMKWTHILSREFPDVTLALSTNGSTICDEFISQLPKNVEVLLSCLGGKSGPFSYEKITGHSWNYIHNICRTMERQGKRNVLNLTTDNPGEMAEAVYDFVQYDNIVIAMNPIVHGYYSSSHIIRSCMPEYKTLIGKVRQEYPDLIIGILNTHDQLGGYLHDTGDSDVFIDSYSKRTVLRNCANYHCRCPFEESYINANGDVGMCCVPESEPPCGIYIIGNMKKEHIITIFNSDFMNTVRARLDHGIPGCQHCFEGCGYRFSDSIPSELYLS